MNEVQAMKEAAAAWARALNWPIEVEVGEPVATMHLGPKDGPERAEIEIRIEIRRASPKPAYEVIQ